MKRYYYRLLPATFGLDVCVRRKKKTISTKQPFVSEGSFDADSEEEALDKAYELKTRFLAGASRKPGDIVDFTDKYGRHTAILLKSNGKRSEFMFVTSNPKWGRGGRKITDDERMLLGYPDRGKVSYFTPVVRNNYHAMFTGKTYPLYRVEQLIEEFKVEKI
jgi:hypothetical protein